MTTSNPIRNLLFIIALFVAIALPGNSQEGSCQGDVQWTHTYNSAGLPGDIGWYHINSAQCVSFGCNSDCTIEGVPVGTVTFQTCKCNDPDAPDCCTLLWGRGVQNRVLLHTSGSCPACGESGACTAKTILVYQHQNDDGSTTFVFESTALCADG